MGLQPRLERMRVLHDKAMTRRDESKVMNRSSALAIHGKTAALLAKTLRT
jgi:hypothetical protein